jgi:replicative DNA helicase Mcm
MVRLSEASARIRLAKKVSLNDAKRATKLIEQSLRDLGTDPETGKIDIDRMEAGTSSVQRSRINTILTIIDELSKEQGPNIKIDDVLIEAANRGIDNLKAVELISKLKSKGDLFEPRQGILKKP